MTVIMCMKKFMTSMSCENDGCRMIEKGAKMPKKHEKHLGPINVSPKGVRSKFSHTYATRSEQSDSRSPCKCTLHSVTDPP